MSANCNQSLRFVKYFVAATDLKNGPSNMSKMLILLKQIIMIDEAVEGGLELTQR